MSTNAGTPALGRYGVWASKTKLTPQLAQHIERLGFGAIWVGSSPEADLQSVEELIAATDHITVATGIVNIWAADALDLTVSYHRIEEVHPGRLLLGIGTGHPESFGARAAKPYGAVVEYLDTLDLYRVPVDRRVLAALGPRMLRLAATRAAGAHPYLVTPAHTAEARAVLGEGVLLAPEQRVVLRKKPDKARALGRPTVVKPYLGLVNYRNNLLRLGYTEEDLAGEGSDHLIDDLVVYGDDATIKGRVDAHLDAGADHVTVQLITDEGDDVPRAYSELAKILGLS